MIKILNLYSDRNALCKPAWFDCVVFMCKAFDVNNERSRLVVVFNQIPNKEKSMFYGNKAELP